MQIPVQTSRQAQGLWNASFLLLALMPLGMAIAHRSATLFMVLSAVVAIIAVLMEGKGRELLADVLQKLLTLPGCAVLAFLLWALISMSWTFSLKVSLFTFGEMLLPAASALIVALTLPQRMPRWGAYVFAGIVIFSAVLIIVDLQTGLRLRQALGVRAYAFIFNRPVLTLFLSTIPLFFLLQRRSDRSAKVMGIVAGVATITVIFASVSGAATMAMLVFIPVYVIARIWPRLAICLGMASFALILACAPFYGILFNRVLPERVVETFSQDHSYERVALWESFGYAIRAQPLLGGGFGVSPVMASTSVVEQVPLKYREMLAIGHPHNAAMQIWVEMGAVGALLALIALFSMLRAVSRLPSVLAAEQLAWIASVSLVAIVGHGAWQGWWIAALGAGVVWFRARRLEVEGN